MRDRLIELLKKEQEAHCKYTREKIQEMLQGTLSECLKNGFEFTADYLIANSVIALPELKHKQVLYVIYNKTIKPLEVSSYMIRPEFNNLLQIHLHKNGFNGCCTLDDFGKTVFLTREEAEAALKGGAE